MRTTILTLAAAGALALAGPAAVAAQGPPAHAQGERGKQKAERGTPQGQGQAQARAQGQGQGQAKGQGQGQAKARPQGQGQGQAKGQGQARGQGQGQGQDRAARAANRGPGNRPAHAKRRGGPAPDPATFNRNLMERAVNARARRHADARDIRVDRQDGWLRVASLDGGELFTLKPETVDNLGYWRAAVVPAFREDGYRDRTDIGGIFGRDDRDGRVRYPDDDDRGPPAFCRSGAGHPVWGRDWCLDKGFGLGDDRSVWGVDRDIGDIILRRPDPRRDVLDRGGLIDVLGDIVFGRLAVQSLVLGADEPMTGHWIGRTEGPRTLRVTAGDLPVAELVDYDRDDQVDTILFNLGG